jgi:hypothetical protein
MQKETGFSIEKTHEKKFFGKILKQAYIWQD